MDFIVQLPLTKEGHDTIVVFVDRYTKRAYFKAMHTSATAPEVAKIFFATVFKNHGLPKAIISDRDPKFTSHFWQALFQQLGTKLAMSTAFHPQTDGQTERMNRTLEEMLRIYATYKQDQWDNYLPAAEFAYNNSKQASTGYTPFELDTGRHPITPMTLNNTSNVVAADDFVKHWKHVIKITQDHLMEAQDKQQKYANQHRRHEEFEVGTKVLLNSKNIIAPVNRNRPTQKLTPKYLGPYEVVEVISPTAYRLALPPTLRIHPVFHIALLKKYVESDDYPQLPPPPPVTIGDEDEYEVEQILDKRVIRKRIQYLIKWQGYPLHDATWEPIENLENAPDKVKDFESMRTSNLKEGRM